MQFEKLMAIAGVTGVVHPIANTCNRVTPLNITTPREAPFQLPGGGGAGLGRREARKLGARTSARHMYNINYYRCLAQVHRTAAPVARRPGGFCGAAHQLHASAQPHLRGATRLPL